MPINSNKKIVLSGGGTGGPVTPLLAILEELKEGKHYDFLFIGTKNGPEREMVDKVGVNFKAISSGKLRRYFSWQNLIDPFRVFLGFWQSFFILLKFRPNLVISAGGFVSVGVVWSAWFLRIPVLIHQQDLRPGLANKLMAPFARVITVTFEKSLTDYGKKAVWTGNPVRKSIINYQLSITNKFKFSNNKPIVLVVGGGTGSVAINDLVIDDLEELTKFCNVIHVTGKGRVKSRKEKENYQSFEFLNSDEIAEVLRLAKVVVSRCGLGFLTEISYLSKASILIPMPDTHQEDNARIFRENKAAIVMDEKKISKEEFIQNIKKLLVDDNSRLNLEKNIKKIMKENANEKIVEIIEKIIRNF